ncbi:MAG: helix-turn-helix domain-containing protein [Candidatus Aenigmatarchaeota archaeon]
MEKICPIIESIKMIGTKHRLIIIRMLKDGEKSFNEMKKLCKMSSKTLSINLKYLVECEIVNKRSEGNKNIYFLTQKGKEITPILEMIGEWGKKWKIC